MLSSTLLTCLINMTMDGLFIELSRLYSLNCPGKSSPNRHAQQAAWCQKTYPSLAGAAAAAKAAPQGRSQSWGGGVPVAVEDRPSCGVVEQYYMAVPAVKIMEACPSFMVARPEVFRRPCDSVVHPDETLNPGEKYFVVPRRTLQKLRRRIRRPKVDLPSNSFASQSSRHASPVINEASYSTETDTQSGDDRMRFSGIEGMQKNGNGDEDPRKMTLNPQSQQRM